MQPSERGDPRQIGMTWRSRRAATVLGVAVVLGAASLAAACSGPASTTSVDPALGKNATAAPPPSAPTVDPASRAATATAAAASATPALDYARYGLPADGSVRVNDDLKIPRMTTEQAAAAMDDATTIFVDTRQDWEFKRGHIPGARRIQAYVDDHQLEALPRDRTLVFYCACSAEQSSARAAVILRAMGHERVYALKGGWHAWLAEKRPVERSR